MQLLAENVKKGQIIVFASYMLRVEREPVRQGNMIVFWGRQSTDGCPTVTKKFLFNRPLHIEAE